MIKHSKDIYCPYDDWERMKADVTTVLRSCEHTMKKQFDYLQALDSSNTCVQCTGINGERMKEMESKRTTAHMYVRTYAVSYSNYPSKFHYSFLINKNIRIEDAMETSSSDKRTGL